MIAGLQQVSESLLMTVRNRRIGLSESPVSVRVLQTLSSGDGEAVSLESLVEDSRSALHGPSPFLGCNCVSNMLSRVREGVNGFSNGQETMRFPFAMRRDQVPGESSIDVVVPLRNFLCDEPDERFPIWDLESYDINRAKG